jgi:ribonuclease BN (tRNA processing enzyme)
MAHPREVIATAVLVAALSLLPAPAAAAVPGDTATVILLGTGTPYPSHLAQGPATAVAIGPRLFVFDAGAGVSRQLEAAGVPVRGGPTVTVLLTHLHSDHTLGLPDLILTSWIMGRSVPMRIVGPPGTRRMVDHLLAAWSEDIAIRERGLEHDAPGGWKVDVRETRGGIVYDSAGVRIRAFPVRHGSWPWAFGYRVDTPGKSIVISGDTAPSDSLAVAARGVDVLVHEAYPESRLTVENRPGGDDWPRYMRAFHTSDRELGALAARARPGRLVLTHIVRMGGTNEDLERGVRAGGYDGVLVVGRDLDRL